MKAIQLLTIIFTTMLISVMLISANAGRASRRARRDQKRLIHQTRIDNLLNKTTVDPLNDYENSDDQLSRQVCEIYFTATGQTVFDGSEFRAEPTKTELDSFIELYGKNIYNKKYFPETYRTTNIIYVPSMDEMTTFTGSLCKNIFYNRYHVNILLNVFMFIFF